MSDFSLQSPQRVRAVADGGTDFESAVGAETDSVVVDCEEVTTMGRKAVVLTVAGLIGLLGISPIVRAAVWPTEDWSTASPESQGLSGTGVNAAADYARKYGGGSGCIIRHGYLVKEWGDPNRLADIKSATKGSAGTTLLGLAVDDGLVKLEDLAADHYPRIGVERGENLARNWLGRITIRQLATMTAGFDDNRPPLLVYEPGSRGIYSNDTSNMLGELLTLKFNEDLHKVLKRRVMDPVGVKPMEWAWRRNAYRAEVMGGLSNREMASGITITHRALARIGYLYLHEGRWKDRQILSREFIHEATRPTALPAPWPSYALYWGSNAKGTYADMPRDVFWALGLGDSFVLVCPSLDIVTVRLGAGSRRSQLPGDDEDRDWGRRVEGFFRLVALAVRDPYPRSEAIRGITWAPSGTIVRKARGSDNWPLTWGDDDNVYTAYGDGQGFEPFVEQKLSLGLARVEGTPPDFTGVNVRSATIEERGDGKDGMKASGLLMVDGVLYMWLRNVGNSKLVWSSDRGRTWTWGEWRFTKSFGCPTFLNFGKNYAGAKDDFVYVYSHDADSAYAAADFMVLARVPKQQITRRDAYMFFGGLGTDGRPLWGSDIDQRAAVFRHKGKCYRSSVSYHAPSRRYLWCQTLPGNDPRLTGGLGIYEGPEPWGPWATVYYTEAWDVGPGETSSFPTKWMAGDGSSLYLVFSGDDHFAVRHGTIDPGGSK